MDLFHHLNASKSQLPNYIFGIIPLMAVLTAKWTDIALTRAGKMVKFLIGSQYVIVALLWIIIPLLALYLFPAPDFALLITIAAGAMLTIAVYFKSRTPDSRILLHRHLLLLY